MKIYDESLKTIAFQQYNDPLLLNISNHIISLIQNSEFSGHRNKILDLGCGAGRTSILLAQKGFDVIGLDLEKKAIEIAKQKANFHKVKVEFMIKDITKPFQSNAFDFVICQEVIEHITNYQDVIKNAFKALKKGGYFMLSTPHDMSQWTLLDKYANHIKRFSIREIYSEFRQFEKVNVYTVGFPFMRLTMLLYDQIVKVKNLKHNDGAIVDNWMYLRFYIPLLTILLKFDDLFNFLPLGTNIVVKAKK